jgi:hypothetical protein
VVQISLPAAALAPFSSYAVRTGFTQKRLSIPSWESYKLGTSEVIHERVELGELLDQVQTSPATDHVK